MKYTILLLFLFAFAQLSGQEDRAYQMQKKYYNDGLSYLKKNDRLRAFSNFAWSVYMDTTGILAKDAGKKRDSLRAILRTKLVNEIQGIWKVITSNKVKSAEDREWYNFPGRIIKITNDSISCYNSRKDFKLDRPKTTQAIKFIQMPTPWPTFNEIIHSNNEVWAYSISENKKGLEVMDAGKFIDEYNWEGMSSHPSGNSYRRIK